MALLSKFADVTKVIEEARKAAQAALMSALAEACEKLREEAPNVTHIVWTQYTPYFNDGDPCEFSIRAIGAVFDDEDPTADDACFEHEIGNKGLSTYKYQDKPADAERVSETANVILGELCKGMNDAEEAMEVAFGDHVSCVLDVATGEVTTEEYRHD